MVMTLESELYTHMSTNSKNFKQQIYKKDLEKNFFNNINNNKNTKNNKQHTNNYLKCKEVVGNNKEFRIQNNNCHLRIIGNNNCIRIAQNVGNVQIIGNSTRLKIQNNSGIIKYTGNEGCISLGSDSTHQIVDYIGCNGLLKIVNATFLNSTKFEHQHKDNINKSNSDKSTKVNDVMWQQFKKKFHDNRINVSLPDLLTIESQQKNLQPHIDHIIIQNSVNVQITK